MNKFRLGNRVLLFPNAQVVTVGGEVRRVASADRDVFVNSVSDMENKGYTTVCIRTEMRKCVDGSRDINYYAELKKLKEA